MFEPADGVTPRWQKLYDLVSGKDVGGEVTYREAAEVLGLDHRSPRGLALVQNTMRTAQGHLERAGERTVGNVAKFGWVVLDAQRELAQADRRVTKARRAAGRALRAAGALNTRREELSQFERERLDWIARSAQAATQVTGRTRKSMAELRRMLESGESAS